MRQVLTELIEDKGWMKDEKKTLTGCIVLVTVEKLNAPSLLVF